MNLLNMPFWGQKFRFGWKIIIKAEFLSRLISRVTHTGAFPCWMIGKPVIVVSKQDVKYKTWKNKTWKTRRGKQDVGNKLLLCEDKTWKTRHCCVKPRRGKQDMGNKTWKTSYCCVKTRRGKQDVEKLLFLIYAAPKQERDILLIH